PRSAPDAVPERTRGSRRGAHRRRRRGRPPAPPRTAAGGDRGVPRPSRLAGRTRAPLPVQRALPAAGLQPVARGPLQRAGTAGRPDRARGRADATGPVPDPCALPVVRPGRRRGVPAVPAGHHEGTGPRRTGAAATARTRTPTRTDRRRPR